MKVTFSGGCKKERSPGAGFRGRRGPRTARDWRGLFCNFGRRAVFLYRGQRPSPLPERENPAPDPRQPEHSNPHPNEYTPHVSLLTRRGTKCDRVDPDVRRSPEADAHLPARTPPTPSTSAPRASRAWSSSASPVSKTGDVVDPSRRRQHHPALAFDKSTLAAIRKWKFAPATGQRSPGQRERRADGSRFTIPRSTTTPLRRGSMSSRKPAFLRGLQEIPEAARTGVVPEPGHALRGPALPCPDSTRLSISAGEARIGRAVQPCESRIIRPLLAHRVRGRICDAGRADPLPEDRVGQAAEQLRVPRHIAHDARLRVLGRHPEPRTRGMARADGGHRRGVGGAVHPGVPRLDGRLLPCGDGDALLHRDGGIPRGAPKRTLPFARLLFAVPFVFSGLLLGGLRFCPAPRPSSTPRVLLHWDLVGSAAGAFAVLPAIAYLGVEAAAAHPAVRAVPDRHRGPDAPGGAARPPRRCGRCRGAHRLRRLPAADLLPSLPG